MSNPETNHREARLAGYLHLMQALQAEMAAAMESIAANELARFQESVARQEVLCAELTALARVIPAMEQAPQLREATSALQQRNQQYGALLRHAGRTNSLLLSLCHTYSGHQQEVRSSRSKFQTWSCEM